MAALLKPLLRQIVVGAPYIFTPLELFSSGEQGAWYDPSDLTTLFQDSAGTTPVTTDGDPVGLMLDKSKGLERGDELWTNTLTGIEDIDSVGSYDANSETFTNTGTGTSGVRPRFNFAVATEVGKTYEVLFTISAATEGVIDRNISLYLANSTTAEHTTVVGVEAGETQHRALLTCATAGVLRINTPGDAGNFSLKISIDQLKELTGNHATQPSSGLKPIYRTDGTLHWLEGDGFDDTMTFSMLGLDGTPIASALMGVEDSGSETLGAAFFLNTTSSASVNQMGMWVPRTATEWGIRGNDGVNVDATFAKPVGASVFSGIWRYDGASTLLTARSNGSVAAEYSATTKSGGVKADATFSLFSRSGGVNFSGKIFQFLCVEGEPEFGEIESYIAAKSGVAL